MSEMSKTIVKIFAKKGEMSDRARSLAWSQTSLGAVETWSLSLKTALSIVFNACNPMFLLWGDDRILFYNDAYNQQLQAHQQSLPLGQSMQHHWLQSWQSIQADIEQVFATGQPLQRENQKWLSDRTTASSSFNWSYSAIWDETDRVGGVLATGYEVVSTTPTTAPAASSSDQSSDCSHLDLEASEAKYRTLIELSTQHVWMLDAAGELVFVNQNFLAFFGRPLDALKRENWAGNVHHPDDHQRVLQEIGRAMGTGTNIRSEHRLRRHDDQFRWFLNEATPLRDASGEITHWIGNSIDIDDIKQTQEALRESEELRQRILESSYDCIKVLNLNSEVLYISAGGLRLLEIDEPTSILNTVWDDLWQGDDHEKAKAAIAAATLGHIGQFQGYLPTAKGTPKWWDSVLTPVRDAAGQVVQLVATSRDITKAKQSEAEYQQAERALQEAHVQLESALAAGAVYTWRWHIPVNRVVVNAAFAHLFAVDPAPATTGGLPIEVFIKSMHEEDAPRVAAAIQQAIETGEEYVAEYRVQTASGEERWVTARGRVEYDATGNPVLFPGALIDITDRKRAEAALQESEECFRTLADNIAQFAWIADDRGWIFWYNQRWFDYTGTTLDTMQGWGWQQVHHPDHVERVTAKFRRYVETGETWEDTFPLRSKDGEYRWFLSRAIPIRDAEGNVSRWFGTNTDITDRVQLEQERDQLLERAHAAREEAERANRIKDEFLAVLSHELRSPLNPILGWSKLLQQGKLDDARTATALATIERNAKLQVQLIDDLLDVSRILQGKLTLNTLPVHLPFVLSAAIETVRLAIDAKAIQLELLLDPDVGQILGDAARLQQVVWNLLSNAAKFTPSGGQITVSLTQVGTCAQLQVKDNGKGIHPTFLPNVFEHFRQEDGATTRQFGGLGLGLAIVRQIVELHGGTVKAESPGEGLGATFTVKLPLVAIAPNTAATSSANAPAINLEGLQILVVDDEADMRELATFILEQHGAVVTSVASAQEALTLLDRSTPDLLISDIGMADMDGYMLIQQVRQRAAKNSRQIPAIALTAYAGEFNQQQALAAGYQEHIAKPVEPEVLLKAIARLLKNYL